MSNDPPTAPLPAVLGACRSSGDFIGASNARYFREEELAVDNASPRRYSLLCHDTRTRVVVGGQGVDEGAMIPAIASDDAMDAFCAFLMHNRSRAMYLHTESSAQPWGYENYYEFSAWSHEPPPA